MAPCRRSVPVRAWVGTGRLHRVPLAGLGSHRAHDRRRRGGRDPGHRDPGDPHAGAFTRKRDLRDDRRVDRGRRALPRLGRTGRSSGGRLADPRPFHPRAALPVPRRYPGLPRARPRDHDRPRDPDESLRRGAGARGGVGFVAERADALIIGGGVIGASIAYHLTLRGLKPRVFERNLLGSGNTGRSAGGIRAQFTTETNIRLSLHSIAFYERFREILGADAEFHQVGYLFLAVSPEQLRQFEERVAFQRRFGVQVSLLTREEVASGWPFLRTDDVYGATYSTKDGFAGPYEVTIAFANAAKQRGAVFHEQAEVLEIVAERGAVRGLKTSIGEFSSGVVVAAAGPAIPALVKPLGIEVPVLPYRRHLFMTETFPEIPDNIPFIIDSGTGLYFRKETGGIMLGMVDKSDPPTFSTNVDEGYLEKLVEAALMRAPILEKANILNGWAGLYDTTPDHHAIVGPVDEVKGLYLAVGFSGHGFMHSPAIGAALSELIVDGAARCVKLDALSLNRFAAGAVVEETNVI
ncbi:MAG: FAD-dependent oxidoreductase [Candidatus Eisenbacteria bacterium]|uniref:FAD-dependent oxidoreductase n=1 Tax=Eiseniibacteriota bacterium TaxID=2212470 RepID=A0A538T832_UNCEI|nr:MAG: FAD-dependent oxidoreductase [Candidatus Eisenbacteria bacterium]